MNTKIIAIILVALILTLVSTITVTYSKFIESIDGNLSLSVAKPICNLILQDQTYNLSNSEPCSVYFEVNNYDNEQNVSDVAMQYNVYISFDNISQELYPEYKLYKISESGIEEEVSTTITPYGIQTPLYTFNASDMETHKYRLELSNPNTDDLLQLCFGLGSAQVKPK